MAQQNRHSAAQAKTIAAKENSQAVMVHALLIAATFLGGLIAVAQLSQ